jgi:branched-chain amino acid aminotransferase
MVTQRPDLLAFFNGKYMPQSQAAEEMKQTGFQSVGGFYDNERTFGGRVFKLEAHLARLYRGLTYTKLDAGMTPEEMAATTGEVLQANLPHLGPGEEFLITQIVSPRPDAPQDSVANVVVYCQYLDLSLFAASYSRGVRIVTPVTYAVPPKAQDRSRGMLTYPLMMDGEGNITECQGGNFMFVQDGRVKLPDRRNVLAGISMETVLELSQTLGFPVDEGDYSLSDVYQADEAFVTGTRFCMLPVASVNGLRINKMGVAGQVTQRLLDEWKQVVGMDFVRQSLDQAGPEAQGQTTEG